MMNQTLLAAAKLFLPSWNFFDDVVEFYRLEVRLQAVAGDFSEWFRLNQGPEDLSWTRVFWNPDGNRRLFERSLVERLTRRVTTREPGLGAHQDAEYRRLADVFTAILSATPLPPPLPGKENSSWHLFQFRVLLVSYQRTRGEAASESTIIRSELLALPYDVQNEHTASPVEPT